jgi:hypothetical protein
MYGDDSFSWGGSIYDTNAGNSIGNPESRSAADYLEYFPQSSVSMPSSGSSVSGGYAIPQISLTPYSGDSTSGGSQSVGYSGSGRSGGGLQYIPPTLTGKTETTPMLSSRTSTTQYIGGGELPLYSLPTYEHPEYDYGRINFLAQQQAAPQYTRLQQGLYAGMGKVASTDNPQQQRMAREDLLRGYGGGVSDIASKSAMVGAQLYAPEYEGRLTEAKMNYQGALTKSQAEFNALMAEWEKSFTQQTTESLTYTPQTSTTQLLYDNGTDPETGAPTWYNPALYNGESWADRVAKAGKRESGYHGGW